MRGLGVIIVLRIRSEWLYGDALVAICGRLKMFDSFFCNSLNLFSYIDPSCLRKVDRRDVIQRVTRQFDREEKRTNNCGETKSCILIRRGGIISTSFNHDESPLRYCIFGYLFSLLSSIIIILSFFFIMISFPLMFIIIIFLTINVKIAQLTFFPFSSTHRGEICCSSSYHGV
jgi:hypothetical protein